MPRLTLAGSGQRYLVRTGRFAQHLLHRMEELALSKYHENVEMAPPAPLPQNTQPVAGQPPLAAAHRHPDTGRLQECGNIQADN